MSRLAPRDTPGPATDPGPHKGSTSPFLCASKTEDAEQEPADPGRDQGVHQQVGVDMVDTHHLLLPNVGTRDSPTPTPASLPTPDALPVTDTFPTTDTPPATPPRSDGTHVPTADARGAGSPFPTAPRVPVDRGFPVSSGYPAGSGFTVHRGFSVDLDEVDTDHPVHRDLHPTHPTQVTAADVGEWQVHNRDKGVPSPQDKEGGVPESPDFGHPELPQPVEGPLLDPHKQVGVVGPLVRPAQPRLDPAPREVPVLPLLCQTAGDSALQRVVPNQVDHVRVRCQLQPPLFILLLSTHQIPQDVRRVEGRGAVDL